MGVEDVEQAVGEAPEEEEDGDEEVGQQRLARGQVHGAGDGVVGHDDLAAVERHDGRRWR